MEFGWRYYAVILCAVRLQTYLISKLKKTTVFWGEGGELYWTYVLWFLHVDLARTCISSGIFRGTPVQHSFLLVISDLLRICVYYITRFFSHKKLFIINTNVDLMTKQQNAWYRLLEILKYFTQCFNPTNL